MGRYDKTAPSTAFGEDRESGRSTLRRICRSTALASLLLSVLTVMCPAQVSVITQHYDISRTGQNTNESILTPSNVNSSQFGQLFSLPVDGQVYAQPLYLYGLQIAGGTHNVVFVATEHDSVYAFDADSNGGSNASPLWQASMLSTAHGAAPGATTVSSLVICDDIVPEYGITGTPVIDPVAGILYVVSFTEENSTFVLRLHALSVTTGAEMLGGPVVIQAQTPGVGNGSTGGVLTFDPKWENQRPGLLLLNGILYIGFASHADNGDWHGWILSYNPSTLAQIGAYSTSPNGTGSGVWMGGDGLAADVVDPTGHPFGRMFVSTGNGDYDAAPPYTNSLDYGDSILNLDLTNGMPTIQDEFTPYNQATLDGSDGDLGAGGVVILPNQAGPYPHLLAQEGKGGTLYLVNRDAMGGYNTTDKVVQEIHGTYAGAGVWGSPSYWNGYVYVAEQALNPLKAYSLTNGVLSAQPSSVTPETFTFPGPAQSISSNGTTNGILWAVEADGYDTGGVSILHAYDATNLATEFYSSNQVPQRDSAGPAVKFAVPTVANGKVYVGTGGQLDVYGLFSVEPLIAPPVISPGSTTFTSSVQVTITDATPNSTIYFTTDGTPPSTSSTKYTGQFTVNSTETITAIAVAPGFVWITPVSATFTSLDNTANPVFSPPGGSFTTSPAVTITDASPNASIYYTTDGSQPSNASTLYGGPIAVTGAETINAIAYAPGLSGSAVVSESYTTQSQVNFSEGFGQAQASMTFNGSTGLDDSRLQLTNGYTSDTGTAFTTNPLNIQAFTTDFLFQLSNPQADGITFMIQNDKPNVIGGTTAGLASAGIPHSLAIKFDFYNDAGEGPDSTGVYVNGAMPTIPAINLTGTGINLLSGDTMEAHVTYDGTNLAITLTDEVTDATFSGVWQENIPQIVGGNTAYIGFTGATQILTASQKIATWTYTATTPGQPSTTATPVISPGTGAYANAQMVTLTDATAGANIYYTTDGTAPTTASNLYSVPFSVSSSETIQVMAVVPGGAVSAEASATLAIASGISTTSVPNYPAGTGFSYGSMILNGATYVANSQKVNGATVVSKALQLTDGSFGEARSAYFANPVNIQKFTTDFDFQMANAAADGFTFVIQNQGLNALGSRGGGLGYGLSPQGTGPSIANSVAVKFDIHNSSGEGNNSVGVYVDGASPTVPATDITSTGIVLSNGDVIHAHIAYDGTNLTLTLTDATTGDTATETYAVNIPQVVGSNIAYIGFTGSTSSALSATENILDWTYLIVLPPTAQPVITPGTGPYAGPTSVTITDSTPNAVIYYTTDGSTPTAASTVYTGAIPVNATGTIQAAAQAPGDGLSTVASATFTIQSPAIAYPSGFTSQGLAFNGGASITGGMLQLVDGGDNEARSAFFTSPMNIQAFTTDFDFQMLKATADGFTFVIQNQGLTALGSPGGGLGYGASPTTLTGPAIGQSVAIKFDYFNNVGEGPDSTGIYENGAPPALPATTLVGTGIVLNNGDVIHAHIVYDGANLTLTLTDATANATFTTVFPVNIPSVVGGNTAYIGFTGGAGGNSSVQHILDWTFVPSSAQTATPTISPATGTFATSTAVAITDTTPGAVIYYTTNGTTPTAASTVYAGQIPVNASGTIQAVAQAPGYTLSGVAASTLTIQSPSPAYPSGFNTLGLTLNGGATVNGALLQLTDGGTYEARSAYFTTPLNVQAFVTDFDFQLLNASADGFAFVIQNQGLNAVGSNGGALGYSSSVSAGTGPSIGKSAALKFDIYSNSGEGTDSTGVYTNGATPTVPATDLTGSGIQLKSGHELHAHIVYDGTNLTLTLTDSTTSPVTTVTESYAVNIPATVGANTAYVGFTAGTGGLSATQNILDWTYTVETPPATATAVPVISPGTSSYLTPTTVAITDATSNAVIYYTTDGSTPTLTSSVYNAPIPVNVTSTIQAMAQAPGDSASAVASATLTIESPSVSYPSSTGFTPQSLALNGGATVNGTVLQLTDGGTYEARSAFFNNPVYVQAFTSDFDFEILNGSADGFAFVIQNQGLTAVGSNGGALGYSASVSTGAGPSIGKSVALKFDIFSNSGEGTDSTGVYTDGAVPTIPATNLSNTGVVLKSGHSIHAHVVYDGTNLTLTLTDATADATATAVFPVNIPSIVGGNTAYVGFTAGTGGSSAVQNILDWSFNSTAPYTAAPAFSLAAGTFVGPQSVTITDATPGAVIYYTTNGTTPGPSSNVYSPGALLAISSTTTLQAIAMAPGEPWSIVTAATYTIQSNVPDYVSGFQSSPVLILNGGATVNGNILQLTDGGTYEARTAYFPIPLNIQTFTTDFDFQILNASADGFTFVIQNQGPNAAGSSGGSLGYSGSVSSGTGPSIGTSVAVKFDIFSNAGEGTDSTGLYVNGAVPTVPATNLTGTGIVLKSGDEIHAHIVYDGTNLTLTLTDATVNATATEVYPVNIPSTVGANTAYVGFTGGAGGTSSTQEILDWTFTNTP